MNTRTKLVKARTEEISKLDDMQLVDVIIRYFQENATMPGEKALKEYAIGLKEELDGKVGTNLLAQVRAELIETFASICVKEVKLKNVAAMNQTKKNEDAYGLKVGDLPLVLKDTEEIPHNTMKNIYAIRGIIDGENNDVYVEGTDILLAELPKGFQKNHKGLSGMLGTIIAKDYSNGKFANMSYSMLIDLGQSLAA